jgi:hypothetical protein
MRWRERLRAARDGGDMTQFLARVVLFVVGRGFLATGEAAAA